MIDYNEDKSYVVREITGGNDGMLKMERHEKYYKDKIKRTVKIPSEMTIGVEIESEGERSQLIRDFGNKLRTNYEFSYKS